MGLGLSPADIAALEARTEGWIASLQLAALSLQGRQDKHDFVAAFSGSHRYVIDYLVDEVMSRQPRSSRLFCARRRSWIVSAPRCATPCGRWTRDEGPRRIVFRPSVLRPHLQPAILEQLERTNLFLIPLDDERRWYRYHHLFADFLQQRLREREPEQIPELHRRASQWYRGRGAVDDAIQHALAAGDLERATRLVDQIAASLVVRREPNKLLSWSTNCPPTCARTTLCSACGTPGPCSLPGNWTRSSQPCRSQRPIVARLPDLPIPGYATTIRAYLANQMGRPARAIDLSQQALEQMADAPPEQTRSFSRGQPSSGWG